MPPRLALDETDRAFFLAPNIGQVSTLRADGTILTALVWVDLDGDEIVLNTEQSRAWPRNVRERRVITVTVADRENPYAYVSVSGHLSSETTEGAFEHGDRMSQKYLGQDRYPFHQPGDVRVLLRVAADRVFRADR